jgi:hypothetical protein
MELFMQENEYYVYIYLDPRKPGVYEYGGLKFDYEPFYVGKGCQKRKLSHLNESSLKRGNDSPKVAKIRKITKGGLNPIIIEYKSGLTESESLQLEDTLIKIIGSQFINDIIDGPLCNMLLGANPPNLKGKTYEEIYGKDRAEIEKKKRYDKLINTTFYNKKDFKHSEESKNKMSQKLKINQANGGYRKGIKHSEETKLKMKKIRSNNFISYNAIKFYVKYYDGVYVVYDKKMFVKHFNISWSALDAAKKRYGKPVKWGKSKGWILDRAEHMTETEWLNRKTTPFIKLE